MLQAADRGDFEPFLQAAQEVGERSETLLDAEATSAACRIAIRQAGSVNREALEARLVAAGIRTQALRDGIVSAVSHQAAHDLRRSLFWLVELQDRLPGTPTATPEDFAKQAYAVLDNRLSEALGEPVDRELAAGTWPARRFRQTTRRRAAGCQYSQVAERTLTPLMRRTDWRLACSAERRPRRSSRTGRAVVAARRPGFRRVRPYSA